MSQVQMTVSDSLAACGFNVYDMQDMREVVSAGAELTVDNLAEMEPLQVTFARLMSKLPTASVLDEDGNETFKVDSTSDAFKDFMAAAKDMALDRLCYATQYTKTFAKIPTLVGALAWVDVSTQRNADGDLVDIDPTVFRHYTTSGVLCDPRNRFKTDDPDLLDQVVKPIRNKMKRAASTTISRLKSKSKGGAKSQEPAKRLENALKPIKALYKWCKTEEFPVKDEATLNKLFKQIAVICGMA